MAKGGLCPGTGIAVPSGYSLQYEVRKQELGEQQSQRGQRPCEEQFVVGDVLHHLDFALFELVDLVVDGLQLLLVRGPEVAAAGHVGDRLQYLFVDLDLLVDERQVAEHVDGRIGGHALRAHADRVDADALRLGDLGRRQRGDLAAVVHAVGQQDDYLRLGLALAQAVDRRGQSVADGRAVLDQSAADAGQKGLQRALVGGQRALREGFAGEGHQSDAVAVAVGDERSGHLLGGRDAVGGNQCGNFISDLQ